MVLERIPIILGASTQANPESMKPSFGRVALAAEAAIPLALLSCVVCRGLTAMGRSCKRLELNGSKQGSLRHSLQLM